MIDEAKLKTEISKRWHKVREDVIAHSQLEYILTEAGYWQRHANANRKYCHWK